MKIIICDKCKKVNNNPQLVDYKLYKVEFGQPNIFGNRGTFDLCEQCLKEFMGFTH